MKFVKKPIKVDAVQYVGTNWEECHEFLGGGPHDPEWADEPDPVFLDVETLHGHTVAEIGDWIIKGPSGDYWLCKPDIFEETYASVPANPENES